MYVCMVRTHVCTSQAISQVSGCQLQVTWCFGSCYLTKMLQFRQSLVHSVDCRSQWRNTRCTSKQGLRDTYSTCQTHFSSTLTDLECLGGTKTCSAALVPSVHLGMSEVSMKNHSWAACRTAKHIQRQNICGAFPNTQYLRQKEASKPEHFRTVNRGQGQHLLTCASRSNPGKPVSSM